MNRSKLFEDELNYIKNDNYRENAKKLLELVPEYFFKVPAASTGKYHPSFAQGERGLVRHTKVAMAIANELLSLDYIDFTENEKDLLLIAILFHDSYKLGNPEEKYTRFDHPLLAADFIEKNKDKTTFKKEEIDLILRTIKTHMGQWNTNKYSKVVLPIPSDKYEFFVHECDYLSSKKYLDVNFDSNDNIIKEEQTYAKKI